MIEFRTTHARRKSLSAVAGYDEIYRDEPIQNLDSLYLWILAQARPRRGERLLDVSCGVGRLVRLARDRGIRAFGVDLSREAVAIGSRAGPGGGLVLADAERLPLADGCFDCVVNVGSLEHYAHPPRGVAEMRRVLRAGGRAVVLLPNLFGYQHVLHVWRSGSVYDDGQPLQRYGTPAAWRDLLEAHGLRITREVKYQCVLPRTPRDVWWYLRRPRMLLQLAISPLVPLHAANCLVFICEKGQIDATGPSCELTAR
jgi:SAM-dependent methyltransferase